MPLLRAREFVCACVWCAAESHDVGFADGSAAAHNANLSVSQLFAHFTRRVLRNLHVVLCFSPLGDFLRNSIRQFPAIVNCCQYVRCVVSFVARPAAVVIVVVWL